MDMNKYNQVLALVESKKEKKKVYWSLYRFESPKALHDMCMDYFNSCEESQKNDNKLPSKIPNVPWLAATLWIRTTELNNYSDNEDYAEVIERAKQYIQSYIVNLWLQWKVNINFVKLYMKNIDWRKEQTSVENTNIDKKSFKIEIVQPKAGKENFKVDTVIEWDIIQPTPLWNDRIWGA